MGLQEPNRVGRNGVTPLSEVAVAKELPRQNRLEFLGTRPSRPPEIPRAMRVAVENFKGGVGAGANPRKLARSWRGSKRKLHVLILDDWGMTPLDPATRHDLLEVIDGRISKSTLITSHPSSTGTHGSARAPSSPCEPLPGGISALHWMKIVLSPTSVGSHKPSHRTCRYVGTRGALTTLLQITT